MPEWRRRVLGQLDVTLVLFDLVLGAIFIMTSYVSFNIYIRGVGVGLLIAGVTSGIAYLYKRKMI